ncbi:LysR family transcriptional regulator [Thalassotalea sp. SU-HH00458]|uniref:LysR family transcriptional regulator n=1 Tax=Thalassotalea sp. SU-HH00458 TaxID=3127657 RepID=UPI0031043BCF
MINPIWLKTFCTLADIGHFTQTAQALFMTQSGVSQQIKKLEQQLDTPLLIREGKSFSLTDAGIKLHQQGKVLLDNVVELADSIKQDETFSGRLKIASPGSVGLKLYPHLLTIQQHNPNLVFDYSFAPNGDIAEKVSKREIDIGLVTSPSKLKNIAYQQIATESLVLITSNKFTSVNWQSLQELGFISHPDAEHHAQQLLSQNFHEFEHIEQFKHKGFSNQISHILEPVSRGLGFSVLPLHAVNAFHQQKNIHVHALPTPVSETLYFCSNRYSLPTKRSTFIKSEIINFLR